MDTRLSLRHIPALLFRSCQLLLIGHGAFPEPQRRREALGHPATQICFF